VLRYENELIYNQLKSYATKQHISINKAINTIIGSFLGVQKTQKQRIYHDMDKFFGRWTEDECNQMQESLSECRQIDAEMWK